MEFITYFITLLLLCSSSAQSDIKTVSNSNKVSFSLPESETVVIAFSQNAHSRRELFGYSFSVQGEEVISWREAYLKPSGTKWKPFLFISNRAIKTSYWEDVWIPTEYRTIQGREVTVFNSPGTRWQVLSLPLRDKDLNKTTVGQSFYVNLPEKNTMWVAFWNNESYPITIQYGGKSMIASLNEWSVISLSKEDDQRKEQRIVVFPHYPIFFQLFSMPLEATGPGLSSDSSTTPTSAPAITSTTTSSTGSPTTSQSSNTKTIIIVVVLVGFAIILISTYFCHWCYCKKKHKEQTESSAPTPNAIINPSFVNDENLGEDYSEPVPHIDFPRPNSSHESENSIYGAVIQSGHELN